MKDYFKTFINTNGEEFPNTKAVNADTPGTTNGTEIIADLLNDIWGFSQALLKTAGITPNGEDENADNSQKLEAIKKLYSSADTSLKEELIRKIESLTASNIPFDDSISLGASNVQELGVKLNEKLDTEINDLQTQIDTLTNATIVADGEEHFSGKYFEDSNGGKKPIYYKYWESIKINQLNSNNDWKVDKFIRLITGNTVVEYHDTIYFWTHAYFNNSNKIIKSNTGYNGRPSSGQVTDWLYVEYTKTTDSLII